ncbi:uncharacterized protein LOC120076244 [Benincasa hispida]|uniref:uncharacterized protein LOC120076244 n=1 Tax=Benincasa hispida TaxID=102211 RepID=UPI0019014A14|nr:uncharacterized protein LOC120076244 [Benincasa hispida]
MSPFEALYRKSCRSPVCWDEVEERKLLGLELVQATNEAIQKIKAHMQTTQSRHNSHVDVRRKDLEFEAGDKVFLKVAHMKGVLRFGRKEKLSPRFIYIFQGLGVNWSRSLPIGIVSITFFSSQCLPCFDAEKLNDNLSYEEKPVEILAKEVKTLRRSEIAFVKVLWQNHQFKEVAWEQKNEMKTQYPKLFQE